MAHKRILFYCYNEKDVRFLRLSACQTDDPKVSEILMLIILTLTFIEGHKYLNHENNKGLIISETVQAMPIKFVVKIP